MTSIAPPRRLLLSVLISTALASLAVAGDASAQSRPSFFDTPSRVVPVGNIQPGQQYPMIIVMPPTNGTSERFYEHIASQVPLDAYYVMLTPGQPQTTDYLPRFYNYVTWADERVVADIEAAKAQHPVDPNEVYLLGFSLGGDTSWALMLRHPELYRGAFVMGARSSARPRGNTLAVLRQRGARVAFAMGAQDQDVRRRGIQRAFERAQRGSIAAQMYAFAGAHESPPAQILGRGLRFMLGR